jgi:hypothetical protein
LVRAKVEEPIKSKGYVARRNPFLFAILESGPPVDGPEDGRGVAMGESELAQLAEPLSHIANRKGIRLAT